nr:extracellular solute-binding protein [Arenimonas sp.]
ARGAAIPSNRRDPQGRWFALSQRARTIVHSTERVQPAQLSTYEALAGPEWKGRLCLRSSKKVYNQSLVATMIERLGAERTEQVVRGWVANLATEPFADDTLLATAIAAGQCDVGLINTYYLGRLQHDTPGFPVQVFWANQGDAGVHVNISGAGVVAASRNKAEATRFLEWLATDDVQAEFARANFETPAKPGVALDPVVAAWGRFTGDPIDVSVAGQRQAEAVRLMDRAGWR